MMSDVEMFTHKPATQFCIDPFNIFWVFGGWHYILFLYLVQCSICNNGSYLLLHLHIPYLGHMHIFQLISIRIL